MAVLAPAHASCEHSQGGLAVSETVNTTTAPEEAPTRRLTRAEEGRWLGGVAAGLGRYFDVNPLVYRIAFAALAFAGGTGILLYVAAWLVIPAEQSADSAAVRALREHRDRPWLLLGVGLLLLGAVLALSEAELWHGIGNIWLAALLGGAALLWWHLAHRDEAPAAPPPPPPAAAPGDDTAVTAVQPPPAVPKPPRKPSLLAPVLGALLAAAGAFGLLAVLDIYTIDADLALAAAVAIVGAAIAVGTFVGYRVGSLVLLGLVLLAGFGVVASTPVSVSSGIGDKLERPLHAGALESSYEYGIGEYEVDLSHVRLPEGETRVDVSLGIGDLLVTVPDDAEVVVDAHAGAGEVIVLGSSDDGLGANREVTIPGPEEDSPTLVLDATIGFGEIRIERG
jgi:phage shock protein PspC (stress-responsive transcriptional regulator)